MPANEITLGDPNLMKRQELFVNFKPYQFIKQVFCDAMHKGNYQVFQHQQQNKSMCGPQDAISLHLSLKY